MTTEKPRSVAPFIGLGVFAAAVALTGVGVAASGAADPSRSGSLRVAEAVPSTVASDRPAPSSAPAASTAGSPAATATPDLGTTAGATSAAPSASVATAEATAGSPKPKASAGVTGRKPATKPTAKASAKATASSTASTVGAKAPGPQASAAASAGAVPGNYAETSTGTASYTGGSMPINGTPTLTVDPAAGQAQTQTVKDGNSTEIQKLVFGTDRVDATEISISSQLIDADFVLSPQEPIAELTAGATWSWKADSTDGKEHLALTGSYAGTEQVTIDGQSETTAIIKSTLTLTGSLAGTIVQTDDYDPTYKLVLRDHSITKGTYMGFSGMFDVTTTLNSLKPS